MNKHIDSPNVLHYSYGFGYMGKICVHVEGSMFEGAPWEMFDDNDINFRENNKWKVINSGAFFSLDSLNGKYEIDGSY